MKTIIEIHAGEGKVLHRIYGDIVHMKPKRTIKQLSIYKGKTSGFFPFIKELPAPTMDIRHSMITNSDLEELTKHYTAQGVTDSRVMIHCGKPFLKGMYDSQGREKFIELLSKCEVTTDKAGKRFIKKILR